MNKETTTWVHGFEQRTGLETDQQRVKEILRENHEPKSNRIEIANRLIEGVTGRDTKLIMTKKELIDLILKDNEDSEKEVKKILSKYRGSLNAFCSHVRQELKH